MSQSFNYRHLFYFWVVAKEGGIARAAERLDMAVQTISAQVRELEKALGVSLLRTEGRNLVLTDAGVAALHEADHIFALGELLPVRVREAASGQTLRLNLGISDGIAKLAVHRLLTPVLDEPHLRLLCHEGEFQPLLGELALHKLDAVLADRAAPPNPALRTTSQLLGTSAIAWYAPSIWAEAAANNFPHSLAVVPVLLPTDHAAMRAHRSLAGARTHPPAHRRRIRGQRSAEHVCRHRHGRDAGARVAGRAPCTHPRPGAGGHHAGGAGAVPPDLQRPQGDAPAADAAAGELARRSRPRVKKRAKRPPCHSALAYALFTGQGSGSVSFADRCVTTSQPQDPQLRRAQT